MSEKAERGAAREAIARYHEVELGSLLARVAAAVDRHRAGELDAFEVDKVIFQYSRAAKKLWVFCDDSGVESLAAFLEGEPQIDWWERGAFRER